MPDASVEAKQTYFEKKSDLEQNHPYYMSAGDYNMDAKKKEMRDFFKNHVGGSMTQIVKDTTRKRTRMVNGKAVTSETTIDLAFLSEDAKAKLSGPPTIHTDAPSDHYMVEFCLDIKVPLKYSVKEYYLDTTRRPPIKKGKLKIVQNELKTIFEENEATMSDMNQLQLFNFIWEKVKGVLDVHNPLNKGGLLKKRIYRFTLSPEVKKLQAQVRDAKNKHRAAKRKKLPTHLLEPIAAKYRELRNKKNQLCKIERNTQMSNKLYDGIKKCDNVWDIIRKFLPDPHYTPPVKKMTINGKSGTDLANHMAKFFFDRAHLVSDEEADVCKNFIPFPKTNWEHEIDIDDSILYDVKKLFKTKKPPSLAAGPDTISHRHIIDLMPVLEKPLQAAINKPLEAFSDITTSHTRLLSKEKNPEKGALTEKSQRPISELNVLPKYGSVKVFIDQLRNQIINRMENNQFAFPGKGGPLATVQILDKANMYAKLGKKVLIVLWDFSNAFCTTIHKITLEIAGKFKLSERMTKLLKQFLEQSYAIIKMSDKDGFYLSDVTHTMRGDPQGQIGSDLIFALDNDGISPEVILDEIIERTKYVDDFTDLYVADSTDTLFASLRYNEKLLTNQATSVGLKLNLDKLKIIPMNIADSELDPEYRTRGPKG